MAPLGLAEGLEKSTLILLDPPEPFLRLHALAGPCIDDFGEAEGFASPLVLVFQVERISRDLIDELRRLLGSQREGANKAEHNEEKAQAPTALSEMDCGNRVLGRVSGFRCACHRSTPLD